MVTLTSLSFRALQSINLCAQSRQLRCFSAETHHTTAYTRRFYTFNPTESQKLTEGNSKIPISNSLALLSSIKEDSFKYYLIFKETQVFQLTKLSGIENVNCELLRGLTKEKL